MKAMKTVSVELNNTRLSTCFPCFQIDVEISSVSVGWLGGGGICQLPELSKLLNHNVDLT